MARKRDFGYGSTDSPKIEYIGKRAPPGAKRGMYELKFTPSNYYYITLNGQRITDYRWGGNRMGRKRIRKEFTENPLLFRAITRLIEKPKNGD